MSRKTLIPYVWEWNEPAKNDLVDADVGHIGLDRKDMRWHVSPIDEAEDERPAIRFVATVSSPVHFCVAKKDKTRRCLDNQPCWRSTFVALGVKLIGPLDSLGRWAGSDVCDASTSS